MCVHVAHIFIHIIKFRLQNIPNFNFPRKRFNSDSPVSNLPTSSTPKKSNFSEPVLPEEIFIKIFKNLSESDLSTSRTVCHRWCKIIDCSQVIWKRLVKNKQNSKNTENTETSENPGKNSDQYKNSKSWITVNQNYLKKYGPIKNYKNFYYSTKKFLNTVSENWYTPKFQKYNFKINTGYNNQEDNIWNSHPLFIEIVHDSIFILKKRVLLQYRLATGELSSVFDIGPEHSDRLWKVGWDTNSRKIKWKQSTGWFC